MKIIIVGGARPNFMKIAPLIRALDNHNSKPNVDRIEYKFVHTGQHYDYQMSQVFFNDLELPEPDIYLGVGSGTHAEQTGNIMIAFESILLDTKPDLAMVVGDVNSTLAGALSAVKLHIPLAHVEAGLRSNDRRMPEEINRVITDIVSDYLFTPSRDANDNLKGEGIPDNRIFLVGSVMVDSLLYHREKASKSCILEKFGLSKREYAVLTLHRPDNVDTRKNLTEICLALEKICEKIPVVFPIHPRTKKSIERFGLQYIYNVDSLLFSEPLGYLEFLKLEMDAQFVMTDSGGVQEETTVLGVPCLTLRNTTERPITIAKGTNLLVGNKREKIVGDALNIVKVGGKKGICPISWDGKAAERIAKVLTDHFQKHSSIAA